MATGNVKKQSNEYIDGRHALLVGCGILLSRVAGLIRDRVFAHYFGNSDSADAFKAAFRIPNFLQNLFGEGVLSASFIPVYSNLLAQGDNERARNVAGAVAGLLILLTSILVGIGILATPWLIDGIAPGFSGMKRDLCINLVRILFPGAGLFVWSAWCLGVLNSHEKFFLSYAAPIVWNLVIILVLLFYGNGMEQRNLAGYAAWASVAGSCLQVAVQFPTVLILLKGIKLSLNYRIEGVHRVLKNFIPVFISRGVVQISAYIDALLASLLPTGAVAAVSYAQTLYTLPVSLFGMSVSAAELPAMSRAIGSKDEVAVYLSKRLNSGLRRIAFFVIPSAVAFIALGDVIAGAIYQTGQFTRSDTIYVWGILAGSGVGLLASTMSRLYSSAFYSLNDTRTPLNYAMIRVFLTTVLGIISALYLPSILGLNVRWGAAGLTASAGVSGWIEFALLRSSLGKRIGKTGLEKRYILLLWFAGLCGACPAFFTGAITLHLHPVYRAIIVLGIYGIIYFCITMFFKIPEAGFIKRFLFFYRK